MKKKIWLLSSISMGITVFATSFFLTSCKISLPYCYIQYSRATSSYIADSIHNTTPHNGSAIFKFYAFGGTNYDDDLVLNDPIKWNYNKFNIDTSHCLNINLFTNIKLDHPSESEFNADAPSGIGNSYASLFFRLTYTYINPNNSCPQSNGDSYNENKLIFTYNSKSWNWERNQYQGPYYSIEFNTHSWS